MITELESKSIQYIRSFAMLSILLCHIQQAYDNKWAWIFNIGVQIFLAISGWLYGKKTIKDWKKWFIDKLYKLYIPYIIYVLFVFLLYNIASVDVFSLKNLIVYGLDLQWILGGVKGITHLWFMTAIFGCYLLTPFLQILKKNSGASLLFLALIGFLNIFVFQKVLDIFTCFWVYTFTYLFVNCNISIQRICIICMLIVAGYISSVINWSIIIDYSASINKLFHVIFGILFVLLPIALAKSLKTIIILPIVKWFDKQSYYIYITHHIFMLGPLSFAYMTGSIYMNIALIVALSIISSIFLKYISDKLVFQLKNIQKL